MKITYAPNPLSTTIELDATEKKLLWYKIRIEEMEERMYGAHYELKHSKTTNMERVKQLLDASYYIEEDDGCPLNKRVDELVEHYVEELVGRHCGDCTCFACSCSKCHAEHLVGVNTIKGLGKHEAYRISGAFSSGRDEAGDWLPEKSLDEALAKLLERIEITAPTEQKSVEAWARAGGFEKHIPRWNAERERAIAWLEAYKAEHFAGVAA